jgi:4'-phosphopantetheinyl transferase EntD
MLAALLPPGASAAEWFGDPVPGPLLPGEEALVARAAERRRREFAAGRRCAREALAGLGIPPGPVLAGADREPLWPAGVVGSITHCDGYQAAAVARDRDLASLGIDAEPARPLPAGVLRAVALPGEAAMLARLAQAHPGTCWDRLLFSAKESVFKAWYPLARRWLGFTGAEIELRPCHGEFTATFTVPGPLAGPRQLRVLGGRFAAGNGLLITVVAVPGTRPAG